MVILGNELELSPPTPLSPPDLGLDSSLSLELSLAKIAWRAAELTRFMKMGAPCTAEALMRTPYAREPAQYPNRPVSPSSSSSEGSNSRDELGRREEPSNTTAPYLDSMQCVRGKGWNAHHNNTRDTYSQDHPLLVGGDRYTLRYFTVNFMSICM